MAPEGAVDLGHGFSYTFFSWDPDRALNPQYADIPSVINAGIIIWRGDSAVGAPWFDTPAVRAIPWSGKRNMWQLVSLDPLHIEPSIQMYDYVDGKHVPSWHGFIRGGRWIPA